MASEEQTPFDFRKIITSPRDVFMAIANVDNGVANYDRRLAQAYLEFCREIEKSTREKFVVGDRSGLGVLSKLIKPDGKGEGFLDDGDQTKVMLSGTWFNAHNLLSGLWSQSIFGRTHGSALTAEDLGFYYVHTKGPDLKTTRIILNRQNATYVACCIESKLFGRPLNIRTAK